MQFPRQTPGVSRKRLRRGMPAYYRNTPQGLSSRFFLIHSSLWLTFKVLQIQHIKPSKKHLMMWPHTVNMQMNKSVRWRGRGGGDWLQRVKKTAVTFIPTWKVSRSGFWKLTLAQPDKTCASGLAGRGIPFPPPISTSTSILWVIALIKLNESDWYPAFLVSGSGIHHLHIWHHTDRMYEENSSKCEREWWRLVSKGVILTKPAGKMCRSKISPNLNCDYTCIWLFRVNSSGFLYGYYIDLISISIHLYIHTHKCTCIHIYLLYFNWCFTWPFILLSNLCVYIDR